MISKDDPMMVVAIEKDLIFILNLQLENKDVLIIKTHFRSDSQPFITYHWLRVEKKLQ